MLVGSMLVQYDCWCREKIGSINVGDETDWSDVGVYSLLGSVAVPVRCHVTFEATTHHPHSPTIARRAASVQTRYVTLSGMLLVHIFAIGSSL